MISSSAVLWSAAIASVIVWGVPALVRVFITPDHIARLQAWRAESERKLAEAREPRADAVEELRKIWADDEADEIWPAEQLEAVQEQLELFCDQLHDLQTCIKLKRYDVAEDRVAQMIHEMEDAILEAGQ